MKIDLHLHTSLASPCSMLSLPALFEAAQKRGIDGICITDHERYEGYRMAARMSEEMGILVFMGIEVRTIEGDILVYSVKPLDFSGVQQLGSRGIRPRAQSLLDFVNEKGGLCVAAHPYRSTALGLGDHMDLVEGLWGVEVKNGNCPKHINGQAEEAAQRLSLRATAGSDAHWAGAVGAYYTEFENDVTNQEEFISALKEGKLTPAGTGSPLEGY